MPEVELVRLRRTCSNSLMKNFPLLVKSLGALAVLSLIVGCMSNAQFKDSELTKAGFKTVPATTPAQQAKLKSISQTKITKTQRKGTMYYVFPDAANNVLYVGKQAQYNVFRQNKAAMEARQNYTMGTQDAFVADDAFLTSFDDDWGSWDALPWDY
jgi:hypothetical protein